MRIVKVTISILVMLMVMGCAHLGKGARVETQNLEKELRQVTATFNGDVGIYARNLKTGADISIAADSLFPTASMIKVPIMVTLFDRISKGGIGYDSSLTWMPEIVNYPPGGMLSSFKDSSKISLKELISLMITYSDNHASLWCQELAGGGETINTWLKMNGFEKTRMNSRTPGRRGNWEIYGWGQTSPREMADLVTMIHVDKAVSPWASEEMYRYLTRIFWDDEALAPIPRTVQVASKQGAVNASRSEVVLVNAPAGDYVFCVITNNQADESWEDENEGFVLLRKVSAVLWEAWGTAGD